MNARPKASVLIPTFNDGPYLREAVDSILVQTFTDFELIIVDDGSTDGTPEILRSYDDPRIRVITHEKNLGRPHARNTALDAGKGEYLFWMDGDDISLPKRLEKQIAFMDAHPDIAVCGAMIQCFHNIDSVLYFPWVEENIVTHLILSPTIGNATACFRRASLDAHALRYDPALPRAQDYDFWCQMLLDCKLKAANLPDLLLLYRVRKLMTPDGHHQEIQRRIFARLGLQPDAAAMKAHFLLTFGKDVDTEGVTIATCGKLMSDILSANKRLGLFPQKRLRHLLHLRLAKAITLLESNLARRIHACVTLLGLCSFLSTAARYAGRKFAQKIHERLGIWLHQ